MTIVRREHQAHFTIVPNAMFLDERLSIEAKGVLGYLLSRPHKWQVRLDHVGHTLRIGRKKLQRIFRELISAGYVTREQQRILDGHRFGEMDYVVRDVPHPSSNPGDNSQVPQVQKGPTAPRVQKGPAYKELSYKNGVEGPPDILHPGGRKNLQVAQQHLARTLDDARFDAGIVALFDDVAAGWELLSVVPNETLVQLRERQRCGDLDRLVITELRMRYRHLLAGGRGARSLKAP